MNNQYFEFVLGTIIKETILLATLKSLRLCLDDCY